MKKVLSSCLVLSCLVLLIPQTYAGCSGQAVTACSEISGVTSSTCGNYYLNGNVEQIQCKWNGSYCSDGGGKCG